MQDFDWQQMMKSPVANWHFVRWLAQRYDGGTPCLLCDHFCIHGHDSKYSDLVLLIININQDMKKTCPCLPACTSWLLACQRLHDSCSSRSHASRRKQLQQQQQGSHASRCKYLQQQQQGFNSQICIAQGANLCLAMILWLSAKKLPVQLPGAPTLEP